MSRKSANAGYRNGGRLVLGLTVVSLVIVTFRESAIESHRKQVAYPPLPTLTSAKQVTFYANRTLANNTICNVSKSFDKLNKDPRFWTFLDCAYIPLDAKRRLDLMEVLLRESEELLRLHIRKVGGRGPLFMGGTLLGAARNGDFLPYTTDIDLNIPETLFQNLLTPELRDKFFARGYLLFKEEGCGRVCFHTEHPKIAALGTCRECHTSFRRAGIHITYIDLYGAEFLDLPVSLSSDMAKQSDRIPKYRNCSGLVIGDFLPPSAIYLRGRRYSAPANVERTLCKLYGRHWIIPYHSLSAGTTCNEAPFEC